MSKVKVDLSSIDGAIQAAIGGQPNPLDEVMSRALESSKGLLLEFKSARAAEAKRFRFYRRRNELRRAGVASMDDLVFTIRGTELWIKREEDFVLKEIGEDQ